MDFIINREFCITLKGRWCDIVVNVHASSEDEDDAIKDSFCEEIERLFDQPPVYHMNILLGEV